VRGIRGSLSNKNGAMRLSRIVAVTLAGACALLPVVATVEPAAAGADPGVEIIKPKLGAAPSSLPLGPATICITSPGPRRCYTPPAHDPPFGGSPTATTVTIAPGREAVLFTAVGSAGGSGATTALALLDNTSTGLSNLFPSPLFLTELSAYQFWPDAAVSNTRLFVTANFVWANDECHFCSHAYTISTYAYDASSGRYKTRDQYTTSSKYASSTGVLNAEKTRILARLQKSNH